MLKPFDEYESFNDFFTRKIKPRQINPQENIILSPSDSKILQIAEVKGNENILVKGIKYNLGEFLTGKNNIILESEIFNTFKLKNPNSKIYQAIFYLNPGDYHRYHSPT